jgi:hypothetical protein
MLSALVVLNVESLGACANPLAVLHAGPPQLGLPITLGSKQRLDVVFDVTLECVNDPLRTRATDPGHGDYRYRARVDHAALDGHPDTHPEDDVCPRTVAPPFAIDPNPDGTIPDRGCGKAKPDRTLGADVVTDVLVR